jgi:16S rRNA processing protein RimM
VALLPIGKVVRAVGLKGQLGIAGTDGALSGLGQLALSRPAEGPPTLRRLLDARRQGKLWVVEVEGISDRAAAEGFVGAEVQVLREDLGEPGEGRYFWADLEGLPVVTVQGEEVGRVTGLYETGAADVLVVEGPKGERLLPLAPYVKVDMSAGRIVVDPPEGLLDG